MSQVEFSEAELQPYRTRGRWLSVLLIVLAVGALAWIDHLVKTHERISLKLIAIVAIGVTYGLAGFFEPLVVYPPNKRFPRRARIWLFAGLPVMIGVGYAVMQVYGLRL